MHTHTYTYMHFWNPTDMYVCIIVKIVHTDYSDGFGGKFGVQTDRVDKSAVGYGDREELAKHESQKGSSLHHDLKWWWVTLWDGGVFQFFTKRHQCLKAGSIPNKWG